MSYISPGALTDEVSWFGEQAYTRPDALFDEPGFLPPSSSPPGYVRPEAAADSVSWFGEQAYSRPSALSDEISFFVGAGATSYSRPNAQADLVSWFGEQAYARPPALSDNVVFVLLVGGGPSGPPPRTARITVQTPLGAPRVRAFVGNLEQVSAEGSHFFVSPQPRAFQRGSPQGTSLITFGQTFSGFLPEGTYFFRSEIAFRPHLARLGAQGAAFFSSAFSSALQLFELPPNTLLGAAEGLASIQFGAAQAIPRTWLHAQGTYLPAIPGPRSKVFGSASGTEAITFGGTTAGAVGQAAAYPGAHWGAHVLRASFTASSRQFFRSRRMRSIFGSGGFGVAGSRHFDSLHQNAWIGGSAFVIEGSAFFVPVEHQYRVQFRAWPAMYRARFGRPHLSWRNVC